MSSWFGHQSRFALRACVPPATGHLLSLVIVSPLAFCLRSLRMDKDRQPLENDSASWPCSDRELVTQSVQISWKHRHDHLEAAIRIAHEDNLAPSCP